MGDGRHLGISAPPGAAGSVATPLGASTLTSCSVGGHFAASALLHLTGQRVVLRGYRMTDVIAVWQAIEESRASLARWVPNIGGRHSAEEVRAGLADLVRRPGQRLILAVWEHAAEQFLGEVGLYEMDPARGAAEIGYWFRLRARGQGYASEAVAVLLSHLAHTALVRSVEARVPCENHASRRLVKRLGFSVAARQCPVQAWEPATSDMLLYARELASAPSGGQVESARPD